VKPKVCYVLPKYDPASEEHFYHIYGFLEHLSAAVDLFLIVERAAAPPPLRGMTRIVVLHSRFPLRTLEMAAALLRARLGGWRLFYVHYSYVGALAAAMVARLSGGRVFYWNCGLAHLFFRRWAFNREALAGKVTAEIPLRLSLRTTHYLVTGTPGMAAYYTRHFGVPPRRIVVLPNEIDLTRFASPPTRAEARARWGGEGRAVVLYLHRLSPRKGAELLPAIVARVAAARPDALFLIAGDGPSRAAVEAALAGKGLGGHAPFLGWVPNREAPGLFAAADLFIMPSLEEGFPRVLLEAMAAGTPFVATDIGGVREICPPAQQRWLTPPGDPERFAQMVIDLLAREEVRRELADAGRAHVHRYALPVVAGLFQERIVHYGG